MFPLRRGHLHEWPSTPVGRSYNRVQIATCNKWVAVNATKSPAKSLVDADAAPVTPPTAATGTAILWNYQYKNCSGVPSAGVDVFINLTDAAGKPAGGIVTDGTVHIGKQDILAQCLTCPVVAFAMLYWPM